MQQPTRLISTPFAQEGDKTEIQNVTGEFDNSATYRLGFPPLTMQSIRLGGKPPKGTDFNGVLFDITENISFLCKGGRYQYNAGLSTLIGGYPEGSNLLLDDNVTEVVSTVAGNQNNPNINMTGWILKPNKTTAVNVADASGETQQQVNYNGGSKWHSRVGGYKENEYAVLDNGDIVKSTIDGNLNNPNVNRTGWFLIGSDKVFAVESVADLIGLQAWDGRTVRTKSYRNGLGKGGALYVYDPTKSATNNNVTIINGWVLQDKISVYRSGAYGDGTTDDTTYFQRAIDYSTYNKRNVDSSIMNNLLPASTNIVVDSGNYVLSDYLKTRGNMVVWDAADNVNFVGADNVNTKYLCGLVKRGDKISRIDNLGGTYDNAAPLSVINNAGKERSAGLQGYPAPHLIQKYDGGEQVGIFIDTHVDNPFVVSSGDITYTGIDSCTIRNVTPALYAKLTVGTPIITQHSTPYKGQVKSIEYIDATTLNITLWGFYLSNPNVSDADATYDRVQPPEGFGAYFGYLKSAFGANITAWNENTVGQSALCGIELDMYNQATDENNDFELLNTPSSIGYYMANLGTKYIKFGFYGGWGNTCVMYMADSKYGKIDTAYMFRAGDSSYKQQNFFTVVKADNKQLFKVSYNAIELGSVSDADANVMDFHSSGFDNDYDARILVSGGVSGSAQADMTILAGSLTVGSHVLPETTNTYSLGSSAKTWSNIYSKNPVTVVSDKNAKNSIQAIDERVLTAWSEVQPRQYKLNGDDSWSFGYIAQDVIEAFSKHGLDYKAYNIVHEEDGKFMLKYDMCAVLNSALNRK